jgi:hypothetical protein
VSDEAGEQRADLVLVAGAAERRDDPRIAEERGELASASGAGASPSKRGVASRRGAARN